MKKTEKQVSQKAVNENFKITSQEKKTLQKISHDVCNINVRLTPLRETVYLFVLRAGKKGISAYQILDGMKEYYPNAKPATVYRSLEYLQQAELIEKIESKSKFVTKRLSGTVGVTLFMVCSNCGSVSEYNDYDADNYIEKKMAELGCIFFKKSVEISVICPDCQKDEVS